MEQVINHPLQDERVQEILRGLAQNQTRDELAEQFGHKNYKTLDIYMRRRGFSWDRQDQTYKLIDDVPFDESTPMDRTKAGKVTMMLNKEGADVRTVAQRLQFKNHFDMAQYMKGQGYRWDDQKANYVKQVGKINASEDVGEAEEEAQAFPSSHSRSKLSDGIEAYLPLLEMLDKHKERLLDLVVPGSETGKLPRYTLRGQPTTKTIQMITSLKEVIAAFSIEKNITQREVFEVALIEFFQKYGYEHQIETLLSDKK